MKRAPMTRGLNPNFNHRLKYVFKSAALVECTKRGSKAIMPGCW